MPTQFDLVEANVKEHLKRLVKTAGMPENSQSLELLAASWLEKQALFKAEITKNRMELVDAYAADEPKGALIMTYSGSLITIGPDSDDGRQSEYASIGLRMDVPQAAKCDNSVLAKDIAIDGTAEFTRGPIQKSSPVFAIAVVSEDLAPHQEEELLDEVTMILTKDFVGVNKTMIAG